MRRKERQMIKEKVRELGIDLIDDGIAIRCVSPFSASKVPLLVINQDNTFVDLSTGIKGDEEEFFRRLDVISKPVYSLEPAEKKEESEDIKRYKEIMAAAWEFYTDQISKDHGDQAVKYLDTRGFETDGFGFTGKYVNSLYKHLIKSGYKKEDIFALKLAREKEGKFYDTFIKRVMIPIRDSYGDIVAFGGRIIEDTSEYPKYVNSAESPIFSKRELLFGYDVARTAECNSYILCEGYMDVLSLHQAGFINAVGSLGTALTEQQCMLMKNKQKIYVMYDSDEAGIQASIRAIPMLQGMGFLVKRIDLHDYKDPDEILKKKGRETFIERFKASIDGTEYMLQHLSKEKAVEYLCNIAM